MVWAAWKQWKLAWTIGIRNENENEIEEMTASVKWRKPVNVIETNEEKANWTAMKENERSESKWKNKLSMKISMKKAGWSVKTRKREVSS